MFNAEALANKNTQAFSRLDLEHPLSTCSSYPIVLEDKSWLSCEHYYSANIVRSRSIAAKIEQAPDGIAAYMLARPWYRWKRLDYKKIRAVLMTRALYTKVQMYEDVRDALLATGDDKIIETSLYDYYWGIGRDLRGENHLGKIWMDIRKKISEQTE